MKHKWIIISLSVVFFLTALTLYVNRVVFPNVVRKIAVEQAENYLKRKVEIGSIGFNWLKGVVIDRIKISQKDAPQEVFVQAEKITIAIVFIPGFKQHQLILSSISIHNPSVALIHQGGNNWNFTDLLTPPPGDKPLPVDIKIGGINVIGGKIRLDMIGAKGLRTEIIDPLDLHIALGFSGIGFKGDLALPQKKGSLKVDGSYQPVTQTLKSMLEIKNIRPSDYMDLVPIAMPITLNDGIISHLKTDLESSPELVRAQGDVSLDKLDIHAQDHHLKGDIKLNSIDLRLSKNNAVAFKGLVNIKNTDLSSKDLTLKGDITLDAADIRVESLENIRLNASLKINTLALTLPEKTTINGDLSVTLTRAELNGPQALLEGQAALNNAVVTLNETQSLKGDLKAENIKIEKNADGTRINGALTLDRADIRLSDTQLKASLKASPLTATLDAANNLKISSTVDIEGIEAATKTQRFSGRLHLKSLKASLAQEGEQLLDIITQGTLQDIRAHADKQGDLSGQSQFDVHVAFPLKNPAGLEYNGSLSFTDGRFEGLGVGAVDRISLTTDFKTDTLDIQQLSLSVLDTPLKASGRISRFANPLLDIKLDIQRVDLGKLKTAAPELLAQHGLTVDGESSLNLHFKGSVSDWLNADINAVAVLKEVNVTSVPLKQSFKDISGTLKASGNSLAWNDFSVTIMDHPLKTSGDLVNFKHPTINAKAVWNGLDVRASILKKDNVITLKEINGQYLSVPFSVSGTVDISQKEPLLNIDSRFKLKLEEIHTILPSLKTSLEPLKLTGNLSGFASIKGQGSDWTRLTINAGAQSDLISIAGFKFDGVNLDIAQAGGKIEKANITSRLYEGDLNIVTTADISDRAMPFQTALHIENVNLAKLKNDTGAKDEDLRGFIALTAMVNGKASEIMNIKGKGSLNVSQGYLMKKEFSSLFVIPELSNLVFTDATANFTIEDQLVSTDNFALKSAGAVLNGKGTIGFDQRINFELHPEFNAEAIAQSESMRKGPSALIASAAGKYLTFTISGTLQKPEIRTIKRPSELIKKTGEIITENVGQILQGIFQ